MKINNRPLFDAISVDLTYTFRQLTVYEFICDVRGWGSCTEVFCF